MCSTDSPRFGKEFENGKLWSKDDADYMKPLHVRQLVKLFKIITAADGEEMMTSGLEVYVIKEAIKVCLSKIPTLDHLKGVCTIEENIDFQAILKEETSM